jgi:hypothetical protein
MDGMRKRVSMVNFGGVFTTGMQTVGVVVVPTKRR